jgi:hypothetical protein
MITFLPSTDFGEVARCLDDKRLGAQRYEAWSILKWLRNPREYPKLVKAGYCLMWKGYEEALVQYTNAMLIEWARRGKTNDLLRPHDPIRKLDNKNTNHSKGTQKRGRMTTATAIPIAMPPWLGTPRLHSYHRHALVAKFPEHYSKFGWSEDGSLYNGSYLWPVPVSELDSSSGSSNTDNEGGWVLRWPKSFKLPPVPIGGGGAAVENESDTKRTSKKFRRALAVATGDSAGEAAPAIQRMSFGNKRQRRTLTLRSGRRL